MDLPTYTNIWRIEKRLYKLYDLRLPMPLPLVQIGVFLGVFVPWIVLLRIVGIPFASPWHVLYIVPPGVLTWLATRPVIEGKRLTELLLSQSRYLSEPRTWCRLTPIREPREVVIVARVWRRAEAPAPVAAAERAAIKSRRKRRAAPEPVPALLATPATSPAPPTLGEYAAQRDARPEPPQVPAGPPSWRRATRDISHEEDVQPTHAELEHPPATPQLEAPPPVPGSGKRALVSGIRRPGAPTEFWHANPTRPDIPQHSTPPPRPDEAPRESGMPRQGAAPHWSEAPPRPDVPRTGEPPREAAAPRPPEAPPGKPQREREPSREREAQHPAAASHQSEAPHGEAPGNRGVPRPAAGAEAARGSGGEAGDKKVAGKKESAPQSEAERSPAAGDERGVRETRRDVPRPWAPPQREAGRAPVARPDVPRPTRPDIPMVPGAFGARPGDAAEPPAAETPRMEAPRPWSEGLSKPRRPEPEEATWPAAAEAGPVPAAQVPVEQPPVEEEAPPREVRSQPASPVRPRPLPPPPAPPPSGPAITPPDPEHEVSGGGLRRLFHAVGGGHGDVDADYQQRLQQPFHGTRHVVVLGCTGGAGQTVTALMLGHTFAQHNGEPVVAIDVNPGPGALARRTRSDTNETLTGLITRADQVGSLTAMRRYTSQAKSGLDVIAAGKNPLQALDDRDYALAIRTIDKFYSVTMLDAAAAVVARVLPYADQIVLVAPASADAPRAVAMTFEWLDGHGYEELRSRAVTVINGVSRRSMDDVEQAEAMARGRCRALVRIPWDDHLSMDRAPRNELKSLRTPTRRAYLALAGVVAGGFSVMPERYQELQQEQEATR